MSQFVSHPQECVDRTIAAVGSRLVIATPLGLGKPVQVLNAFYRRAVDDAGLSLHIVTALCLEVPHPTDPIEARLAGPILERLFGDYEELAFMRPMREGKLPPNVRISELYFRAGAMKNVAHAQQHYISSNYTHIARDMAAAGVNVLAQLVAARDTAEATELSLSCNPDVTLELLERLTAAGRPPFAVAQVHPDLPFMEHDARVPQDAFDVVLRNPEYDRALFAVPNSSVPLRDYAAALHASSLISDGGTLQIGIGSLGDAVGHACILRHRRNGDYRRLLADLGVPADARAGAGPFEQGLYVCTEMFVNGMLHLIEQGVVKRRVFDNLALQRWLNSGCISETVDARLLDYALECGLAPARLDERGLAELVDWGILPRELRLAGEGLELDGESLTNDLRDERTRAAVLARTAGSELRHGRILHGGFFLGPADFYRRLRELDAAGQERIFMTGVRHTNQLLLDYPLYREQRRDARFINTGMMVTLTGAVVSDALEDGTVISGVGGQYNFVAMAHDLPGARSVLCIRSTRGEGDDLQSNIVPRYGHVTIPRHLRDIVVTEYGVADLRGQEDAEIIKRLIAVADARFQDDLLADAQRRGKVEAGYRIPDSARRNTPDYLEEVLAPPRDSGMLPDYPFGTDLTEREIALAASLRRIRDLSHDPPRMLARFFRALLHHEDDTAAHPWLERIELENPGTPREYLVQQLLLLDLEERGLLKVR